MRARSLLGLWFGQAAIPSVTRIHVYPSLHEERTRNAALFLHRGDLMVRPHRQIGRGREFEKLRSYLPGDSLGDIHWKATAKRGHPVTKEFRIERTQEVYCVIDVSRLSAVVPVAEPGGGGDPLLERYITASLLLSDVAGRQGDRFGVMVFSDRPLTFIRAGGGATHFTSCRESLSHLRTSLVTPNYEETAAFLLTRLRRRALLVFLTSLDEPTLAESFIRSVRILGRRHLVLVHTVTPPAVRPLFSDHAAYGADDVYERLAGHLVWQGLRRTKENLRHLGVELSLADHDRLCASLATRYLNIKRRQIL